MKQKMIFIFALAITMCNGQLDSVTSSYIDNIMNAYYKPNEPGAVILIAQEGKVLFKKAYGMANLELNVPQKAENNFAIASNTKQFTAVCILQLVQAGKIDLQDDIKKYIPEYNTHGRHISVENLLTHTSGIVDFTSKSTFTKEHFQHMPQQEIMQTFENDSLQFEPGTQENYSNSGYFLLGVIIEKVTNMTYEEYLQKNIFDVADMKNTYVGSHDKLIPNFVNGYHSNDGNKFFPAPYIDWNWPFSAGMIISNVDDLLKWNEALYTDKLLDQKWIQQAQTGFTLKDSTKIHYGYGWNVNEFLGTKWLFHSGGIDGFSSLTYQFPEKHLYLAAMTNNPAKFPDMLDELSYRIMKNDFEMPKSIPITPEKLAVYKGVFVFEINDETYYKKFTVKNNSLIEMAHRGIEEELIYIGNDKFRYKNGDLWSITFNRDKRGIICSLDESYPLNSSNNIFIKTDKEFKSPVLMLAKLKSTIEESKIEETIIVFHSYMDENKAKPVFHEPELNFLGYELLNNKKVKEAITIFKLNVEQYPNSWNVYDSLAEAYLTNGDTQLSIENYEKSVLLNPENGNGLKMLKKLK